MDRREYLALVLREASALVTSRGAELSSALSGDCGPEKARALAEGQVRGVLVEISHLEDVLKHSELREVPPELWREAGSWGEVIAGAAMAALGHDVLARARDMLEGRLPRLENVQTR